jgi:hypothetical protein
MILSERIGKRHLHEVNRVFVHASDPASMPMERARTEVEERGIEIAAVARSLGPFAGTARFGVGRGAVGDVGGSHGPRRLLHTGALPERGSGGPSCI